MKKRLGMIPRGLEWISQPTEINKADLKLNKSILNENLPASKRGLQQDLIRATFILKQDYLEKIKAYAYWERLQIKDVFEEMCEQFFEDKKIKSVPEKRKT